MDSTFSNPDSVISALGIEKGWHIADLGAGIGFYTMLAARRVGPQGTVFAVDVQKELLRRLDAHVREAGLGNIKTIWGDIENVNGTRLRSDSVDAVIIANVLFQVDDKSGTFRETMRILKPGGKLLFIDWKDAAKGIGPRPGHVYPLDVSKQDIIDAGFTVQSEIDAGAHHYGILATKPQ